MALTPKTLDSSKITASGELSDAESPSSDELWPRHGSRWGATAHNITAMLGAGVLGLPSTFVYLGMAGGIVCLGIFLLVSWYTFILLVKMHEVPPQKEGGAIKRLDTYRDLSFHVLGPFKGYWSLVPFQNLLLYGIAITYTVTGARNMESVNDLHNGTEINKISYWVLMFSACELLLCLVPNFSELGWISALGAITSVLYSLIAIILAPWYPLEPRDNVNFKPGAPAGQNQMQLFFGIFSALSTIAFAFGGHNISLEIQATLPAGPQESTVPPMMFSVHTAFILTGIAYFAVAVSGFWAYGTTVESNILDSIGQPHGAIIATHLFVVLHVLCSYQVYAFPLMTNMETAAVKHLPSWELSTNITRRFLVRTAIRWIFVGTTAFFGCLIPFFGHLMNLFGALAITPTTFVMPCVLWLYWKRPSVRTFDFWLALTTAVVMTLVGIIGTISAVRDIVLHASTYKLFT